MTMLSGEPDPDRDGGFAVVGVCAIRNHAQIFNSRQTLTKRCVPDAFPLAHKTDWVAQDQRAAAMIAVPAIRHSPLKERAHAPRTGMPDHF